MAEKAGRTIEAEADLRHEADVDVVARHRGMGGDEARLAPHQLHETDPVERGDRLRVSGVDRDARHRDRALEAERLVDERDVVVDRLRHADHADLLPPAFDLLRERMSTAHRAVAPDREEDIDAPCDERVDHDLRVTRPARRAEHRPAEPVHVTDLVGAERHRRRNARRRIEPGEPEAEPRHGGDAVLVHELEDHRADDVVDPGADAARGHDPGVHPLRVEVDALARSGLLQRLRGIDGRARRELDLVEDARAVRHVGRELLALRRGEPER